MVLQSIRRFIGDSAGAVAATYALALVGLVAAAGVGFDYARLTTMDSELQSAADQAALAAATQLNGATDAMTRAVTQASNLVSNTTLMSNDKNASGTAIQITDVKFYKTRADAESDSNSFTSADTARYADAHFVRVSTVARKAYYAMTPIVGLLSSGDVKALATAGMGSAICREPPLFVCKPTGSISDPAAWINSQIGKGILMKAKGTSWAPGNFGFLETNAGSGANDIGKLLAYANPPGDCVDVTNPTTAPGQKQSVVADFNTRFDIYENGDNIDCYGSDSKCPPAANSRKDVVMRKVAAPTKLQDCGAPSGGWDWGARPYRPTTAANLTGTTAANFPDVMGYPRDLCHAMEDSKQNCADGFIGTGAWDINAYWWANYGTAWAGAVTTSVTGRSYPTRYEIYKWEQIGSNSATVTTPNGSPNWRNYRTPICRTPAASSSNVPDRRVIPIAVIDCSTLGNGGGSKTVSPIDWMDVFLVEPSLNRTGTGTGNPVFTQAGDFYGEVIGRTGQGVGGSGAQTIRRDKPYLVN